MFSVLQPTIENIGDYVIELEAQLHDPDQTKSATSFTLTIINSCSNAIVNSDDGLVLEDMVAPDNVSTFASPIYSAPSNSVRISSDGLSNCGELSYTLMTKDIEEFNEDWLTFSMIDEE